MTALATTAGMLTWHPHVGPLVCGIAIAMTVAAAVRLHRRMRGRMSSRRAALLLAPKAALLALLLLALFDPLWRTTRQRISEQGVLALVDVSSSMELRESGGASRRERALQAVDRLRAGLPGSAESVRVLEFDTRLREPAATRDAGGDARRGTDIPAALLALAERADVTAHAAVVLITDGGDEPVQGAALPPVPLHVIGVGAGMELSGDAAVADVECPDSVEKESEFEVSADLTLTPGADPAGVAAMPVTLEKQTAEGWAEQAAQEVNLGNGRARVTFRCQAGETGLHRYRVSLPELPDEPSTLNNSRAFPVEVRARSLHVLFFTRDLGAQFKMIRSEVAADPGVTFTALFRTIGERFTVQGERLPGDEELEAGFPSSAGVLEFYDCVVIGSFPFAEWRSDQAAALREYVENGGAVIFLGGEHSFGAGGYAGTPLEAMFPWRLLEGDPDALVLGEYAVSIPAASRSHPILAGVAELLTGTAAEGEAAVLESINRIGPAKPGAVTVLAVAVSGRMMPVAAAHRFGKGRVMAFATNTFWRWALRGSALRRAYGLIWRQAVRYLSGDEEGGRLLKVTWDREAYRPGEQAVAELRLAGEQERPELTLNASLALGQDAAPLPVEPLQGSPGALLVKPLFRERGEYRFVLTAYDGETLLETYEKLFPVAPLVGEGARLEVDEVYLAALAGRGGGRYVREGEVDALVEHLTRQNLRSTIVSDRSLIHGSPHFLWLVLLIMMGEWTLRRRMNLF